MGRTSWKFPEDGGSLKCVFASALLSSTKRGFTLKRGWREREHKQKEQPGNGGKNSYAFMSFFKSVLDAG